MLRSYHCLAPPPAGCRSGTHDCTCNAPDQEELGLRTRRGRDQQHWPPAVQKDQAHQPTAASGPPHTVRDGCPCDLHGRLALLSVSNKGIEPWPAPWWNAMLPAALQRRHREMPGRAGSPSPKWRNTPEPQKSWETGSNPAPTYPRRDLSRPARRPTGPTWSPRTSHRSAGGGESLPL